MARLNCYPLALMACGMAIAVAAQEQVGDKTYEGTPAPEGSICEGWLFPIARDMQILDEHLTLDRAQRAVKGLDEALERTDWEASMLAGNSLKILNGYFLKKYYLDADEPNKELAKQNYCNWQRDEGFWYD